ncbi:MAG: 23S rRNA (guanosine(2251)-2'-O)-methyltransferase RlmB [Chitinophagaceae bacterium]|nr:MAG: 23S rRNA (guanosine(2251)-2'-O)-methyltransferase RlmB [Chitinophagaceae bacterium]
MKNFRPQSRPKKSSLVVGRKQVSEAIKSGKALERIYLQNNVGGKELAEIAKLAEQNRIPVNKVPEAKLSSFNVSAHEGCVAFLSRIQYQELQEVISFVVEKGETPLFVILDGITDIRNIGGIARTAFCTGVNAIIIPDKGVGMLNEDAILTSAGALEKLPIVRVNSLMKAVDELHLNGIKVLANVFDMDFKDPVAIIMGSEEKGIYPALMKVTDEQFKIPMAGDFESLNVSVATGIILYEAMKQRLFANA